MVFRPAGAQRLPRRAPGPARLRRQGRGIERLLARYDIENEDAMAYLEGRLRRIGVIRALEAEGFEPGDEIEIAGVTLRARPRLGRARAGRGGRPHLFRGLRPNKLQA